MIARIPSTDPTKAEADHRTPSAGDNSLLTKRQSLRSARCPPGRWENRQWPTRCGFRCTVSNCVRLTVLVLACGAQFGVRAQSRALLWPGTTRLLDPASNVVSAAIGEQ